jgi:hypothetical protein
MADYLEIAKAALANMGLVSEPAAAKTESAVPIQFPQQEAEPNQEELRAAGEVLSRVGMRLIELEGGTTVGLWSDLDGPEVRAALRVYGSHLQPVRYLDGPGIPDKYKERKPEGDPVPMSVLAEMERAQANLEACQGQTRDADAAVEPPWVVRDRMLAAMDYSPKGTPWAEWKAATLNRIFLEQGVLGRPGRITAETVRDGERKDQARNKA